MASQRAQDQPGDTEKRRPRSQAHVKIEVGELERLLDTPEEAKEWHKYSIYRVPYQLVEQNYHEKNMFQPKMVSIGPYHHGHGHLEPMEEHKFEALRQFLKRSGTSLKDFKTALADDTWALMDSYEELDAEWLSNEAKFIELMILDGCFVLEFFRVLDPCGMRSAGSYNENDPVFGFHGPSPRSKTLLLDILKVENQVPFLVLEKLLAVESRTTIDKVRYLDSIFPVLPYKVHQLYRGGDHKPRHLLDFLRSKMMGRVPSARKPPKLIRLDTKCASIYKKAGIVFKQSRTQSISGFKLQENLLEIPTLPLTLNETARMNILAYESLHSVGIKEIHSYYRLMGRLFQSVEDISLLGIDFSVIEAARILDFLKLLEDGTGFYIDAGSHLVPILNQLNEYYNQNTKKWKMRIREWHWNLKETYFNNPWKVLSLIGALLLLAFTICQTVLSAFSYYHSCRL